MFSCLPSGDSGSFLLFAADDISSCRKSELETLPVGLGMNLDGSLSFTSGEVEDAIEGKPEMELLVELVGDGLCPIFRPPAPSSDLPGLKTGAPSFDRGLVRRWGRPVLRPGRSEDGAQHMYQIFGEKENKTIITITKIR